VVSREIVEKGDQLIANVVGSPKQFHNDTMAPSRIKGLSTALTYLLLTAFFLPSNALYFYINGNQPKCFFEDLPKDTLVVGKRRLTQLLKYSFYELTN
jgi:hypothetical protein